MLELLVFSIIAAVIVGLVVMFAGLIVGAAGASVPVLAALGAFLTRFAWAIGLLAGLVYFVTGGHWRP